MDDLDTLDVLVSEDRDRGDAEPQPHDARLARRSARRELAQDLDVALDDVRGGLELGRARRIELELGGVDDDVRSCELAQLAQLGGGPRRLHGPSTPEHDDLADAGRDDRVDRRVRRVGRRELLRGQREHARDVERDVAVPDHDCALVREVERRGAGSPDGRCTRRRARSRPTSRGDPRRGSRASGRSASRRRRSPRRTREVSSSCVTSRPTSTLPRKRKPGRAAIFSNARETVFSCGWSGATPSRTRPHGVGRRSIMSTSTTGSSLASSGPAA